MNAIILAAGFGERTKNVLCDMPKALIRVADGRTILDHVIADLNDTGISSITIVTNARFYTILSDYVHKTYRRKNIMVVNDGSHTPEQRLGALGDLLFALGTNPPVNPGEPVLVLPSDTAYWNAFSLADFLGFSRAHPDGFITAVYDAGDKGKIRGHLGCVLMDSEGRITDFEEKPDNPRSTLAIVALYIFGPEHRKLLEKFKDTGGDLNSPSNIIPFFMRHDIKIFGYAAKGNIVDANQPDDIQKANEY